MTKLIVAKSAGFCFGVSRAVDIAENALREHGVCYCLGELAHNRKVVERLADKGLRMVESVDSLPRGARVIIRAHGASKRSYDELRAKGAEIINATCPKVSRIHEIVSSASRRGRNVVIIGEREHPEVCGILGWCDRAEVFRGADELMSWLEAVPDVRGAPLTVVFQTTQIKRNLENCTNILKKECTNTEIFDTICGATSTRQNEAKALSETCDTMVVIGGNHSANSVHLAEICRENCDSVLFIESADELDIRAIARASVIGITAGASAPEWTIKEVVNMMSDEIKIEEVTPVIEQAAEQAPEEAVYEPVTEAAAPSEEAVNAPAAEEYQKPDSEKSFEELLEDSIKTIYNGETVTGVVAAITPTEVTVDLGAKHSGYIPLSEFTDDQDLKVEEVVKIGDTIEASVVRVNDVEGTVMLSKKRLDAVKNWSNIEAAQVDGSAVEGVVTEENKGGVVVSVHGVRVFVPASQTGLSKDEPMASLIKKPVRLKITEVNRARRRVVGSIRAVQVKERRERSEKIWSEIEVGKRYAGTVKSLTSYGAFVDIGGIDGMVHISELSWSRIKHPSEVVSVGDSVETFVVGFDRENRKISLGYRDHSENPWSKFTAAYEVGSNAMVKIVKLMPFGAFAEVLPGVDGLIHISQIAGHRIGKPDEVLTIGDEVEVRIINIDNEKQKISLSIRALSESAPFRASQEAEPEAEEPGDDALVYEVSTDGSAVGVVSEKEVSDE